MLSSPRRLSPPRRGLTALALASMVLFAASGCVVAEGTRDGQDPTSGPSAQANRRAAAENIDTVASALRSYAVVDEESDPRLNAHVFGLPGVTSLGTETERVVLESFKSAGAFGDRRAFSPVLTDPAQRWQPEEFTSAPAVNSPTPSPSASEGPAPSGVDISNRIVAAGGSYLISAISQDAGDLTDDASPQPSRLPTRPQGDPAPGRTTHVFVTDLARDTTVDAAELFRGTVDPTTIDTDRTGALLLDGKAAEDTDLTDLGTTVAADLHSPVELPTGADVRDPDYSCALLPCVALTFDDGPGEPELEDRLLAAAKAANVRLTYFLLGKNVEHHPEVVDRMAKAGHELGNHTFNHPQLSKTSRDREKSEIEKTDKAIEAASGVKSSLVRPPYGALSKSAAKALGHPAIMWDVDTEDWRHKNTGKVTEAVRSFTQPGSIVLMHSIHPTTIDAVPDVLSTVADKGLYAVTVSDLFGDQKLEKGAEYFCRGYATNLCSNPEHPAVHRN